MNYASDSSSPKPVSPWFEMFGHKLTPAEVAEMKVYAAECGLTVNEWMDRAIRKAMHQDFPELKKAPSSPPLTDDAKWPGFPGNYR